ncbi:DNA-processing protein DprA [Nocardia thraciensis]
MTTENLEQKLATGQVRPPGSTLSGMTDGRDDERIALLALLAERPSGMSWSALASEIVVRGSAVEIWNDLHPPQLDGIGAEPSPLDQAAAMLDGWRTGNFDVLTVLDPDYPVGLRTIHQLPPILFVRGKLLAEEVGVSVVGSRAATDRGLAIADAVASGLAERGITILSGLAAGIDAAAHAAAIAAGGRPVGVIGTGIDQVYPAANRALHARVAEAGALVSQFLPGTSPQKHNFPMRNATMSGLGVASVVVEAGEHSGSRIQARLSLNHGRPVILTDLVVNATAWGRELARRPGVHVASGISEMMELVEGLITTDDAAPTLPSRLDSRGRV